MNDSGTDVGVVILVASLLGLFGLGIGFVLTFLAIQVGVAPLRRIIDFRLGTLQVAIDNLTTQMRQVETAIVDSVIAVVERDDGESQRGQTATGGETTSTTSTTGPRRKRGRVTKTS